MTFQDALALLREFGFPTFFCLWLMWRVESAIKALVEQQTKMLIVLSVLARSMDEDDEKVPDLPIDRVVKHRLDKTAAIKTLPADDKEAVR